MNRRRQGKFQDFLSRNRSISQRIFDEGVHHHDASLQQLKRFPTDLFGPGGEEHDPKIWEEYTHWTETLASSQRMDFQARWRFEDWQRRWLQRLRSARWRKAPPRGQGHESPHHQVPGSMEKDLLFNTLGLGPSASNEEIKAAYRELASRFHPDREGGDTAKMQELNAAYEGLRQLRGF